MTREPYVALRGFRVWFEKRPSFLKALVRSSAEHVRAVDGIDLDVGKGEVYCLVGESGCGKTTTGLGLLKLEEPTGGDVFVDPPPGVLQAYDAAQAKGDKETLHTIRRMHSFTYEREYTWNPRDALLFLASVVAGALIGADVGFWTYLAFGSILGDLLLVLVGIAVGTLVGLLGTISRARASPRVPVLLGFPAGLAALFVFFLWFAVFPPGNAAPSGLGGALQAYTTQPELFYYMQVFEFLVAMLAANGVARVARDFWQRREGIETPAMKMKLLRRSLQIVFQDPYESLNPKRSVYDIVSEPLVVNHLTHSYAETEARTIQALQDAGLRPPREFLLRYPHELSGGQRQRVCIAGALVLDPAFIVADEPVSMLDVSIRTEIVELLLQLRDKKDLTYLFITHDLSLAAVLADRIGVMYLGKIVEEGPAQEVVHNPRHPYTKALISVVPIPDPDRRRTRIILQGERPDPSDIPPGCRFHPRCPAAFGRCGWTPAEVLAALLALAAGGPHEGAVSAIRVSGARSLILPPNSTELEAWLHGSISGRSDEWRALQGIDRLEGPAGERQIVLREPREPELRAIGPEVMVACFLFDEGISHAVPPSASVTGAGSEGQRVGPPSASSASG